MAPIATLSRVGAGNGVQKHNADWRNTPKATPTRQLQSHNTNGSSKQQPLKPLTRDTRRILTENTEKLMQEREEVDQALLRESQRDKAELTAEDWLPREKLLKKIKTLANQERRHLHSQKKLIDERQRLYKCDPSSERAIDLDLLRSLQWKFKKHLSTYLEDRERIFQTGEYDEDSSSSGSKYSSDSSSDGDEYVPTEWNSGPGKAGPDAIGSSQSETNSNSSNSEDDDKRSISNLDGAFDSQFRTQTKKRKLVDILAESTPEKEQRKKMKEGTAKKEQTRQDKEQTATSVSESLSAESKASSADSNTNSTKTSAVFESMSQRNEPKVKGIIKEETIVKGEAALTNGPRAGVDRIATAKASGVEINVTATNGVTTNGAIINGAKSNKSKIKTDNAPAVEPWYKIHARRMMEPDFDDCVYTRPRKRKYQGPTRHNPYLVSGAISDLPKDKKAVRSALPSPPASSSSRSSDRADRPDKPRGGASKANYPKARRQVERSNIDRIKKHVGNSAVNQNQKQAANSRSEPRLSLAAAGDP